LSIGKKRIKKLEFLTHYIRNMQNRENLIRAFLEKNKQINLSAIRDEE
jgi:16S rRNA G527 N7-methylase RsmG